MAVAFVVSALCLFHIVAASAAPRVSKYDYVIFGAYEQDNNLKNGKEPIEWLVLDVDEDDDKVLLLSRYALENKLYHNTKEAVCWATCDLRAWLNSEFLNAAFSSE